MKIACIVSVVALITVFFVSSCSGGVNHIEKDIAYGPFTIRATATKSKQFNINYGMVSQTDVAYTILHNGKPVAFPDALQRNTGLPYLWRVYALPGAPDPTLIAGSQSLYLIYLKNGAPVVESILEQHLLPCNSWIAKTVSLGLTKKCLPGAIPMIWTNWTAS
jgi:hypothetical protein